MVIRARRFEVSDAGVVSSLIARTLRESNSKDYSKEYIEENVHHLSAKFFIEKSKQTHFYVFCDSDQIVGTGAIGAYWGSETEFSLFDIFVSPDYQGQGIGRLIIETLEADTYFKRAQRVEIPASITGLAFYRHMGYHFKNGNKKIDNERLYRLEKFPKRVSGNAMI
ncbi:GNAT family N-acetyltransferase [Levilactobacillus namurensis]|uniref:GNAT family N-acetyltransferase n=1 Tax=Levilactobacillus namurensis TaxID=380393 RepID=UPI00046506FC|nr:GNAT family N-acetyltransferase [Levilactobacillus namurensis]